jgi:hypothetical protein
MFLDASRASKANVRCRQPNAQLRIDGLRAIDPLARPEFALLPVECGCFTVIHRCYELRSENAANRASVRCQGLIAMPPFFGIIRNVV